MRRGWRIATTEQEIDSGKERVASFESLTREVRGIDRASRQVED
jgi:hypothetical protein